MSPLLLGIAAFVAVAAGVGSVAMLLQERSSNRVEDRLSILTGAASPQAAKDKASQQGGLLAQVMDNQSGFAQLFLERVGNIDINLLFDQADVSMTIGKLGMISGGLAAVAIAAGFLLHVNSLLIPLLALGIGLLPLIWLILRRKKHLRMFAAQLPDALDMLARALRSGQSMGAAIGMVSNELPVPLGKEFGRVFEEQNLGVPLEESLSSMADRIPNLDLRFFATAVILQRQTGGDLAEILDKIGYLVRERFQIMGQVQALTGEGRLSGVVLLALPVLLFAAVYHLNRDYLVVLLTDDMGKKMLLGAIVLQLLGALVIRKIVNIKV
jgi:tight adherence protein B